MVSYFVRYRGRPADPQTFSEYYELTHSAILRRFPNIQSLILHQPVAWNDPFPVRPGGSALLAQMVFPSSSHLDAALLSEARQTARDDFARLPAFEGEVTHEALSSKVIF